MQTRWTTLISTFAVALFGCGDESAGSSGSGGAGTGNLGDGTTGSGAGAGTGTGTGGGGEAPGNSLAACSWEGDDPGGLAATGSAVGDIIANVQGLIDQCGETRSLWDFAGGYRIVVLAEGW